MAFRKTLLSLLIAGTVSIAPAISTSVLADEDLSSQAQAAEKDARKTPPSPFMAVSEVDPGNEKVEEFLDARGWARGESANNPGGGTLVVASQAISADPTSISFSEARILATEEAFLQAMGELVSQDAVTVGVSMADRFLKDDLPEDVRDTTSLDALGKAVASRAAELTVQGLNALLKELGTDPSSLPEMTVAERKDMIYDEFVTETTWRAMGQLSGVGVFGVIEEVGGDGPVNNGRMSVVVVKANRFNEFGRQLRTGDVAPGQAIPVDDIQARLKPQLKEGVPMLGYFGAQPVVDAEGRYGLLSFGMAGPQLVRGTMDEFEITSELEASKETAKLMADAWLAQFASMTVQGQKESTKRKLNQKVKETRGDGRVEIKTTQGIGKMVNNILESEANARLQGVQTIAEWNAVDPATGHPYLGYVKYWSPQTSAKAQGLNKKAAAKPAASGSGGNQGETKRTTRSTGSFGEW
ncbi:MAG: hypothetical protein KBT82_00245 [Marinobacter sp.]|uniref:DUF6844 domain-containing protein n=1 Tax=Marinobacter sp. TaxID=50741 RepID=UPI001B41D6E8|nr:hypothetical protein [Marinobacter sp.]MBQ0745200.1 hypothetical protein [Marinobacter sp.]MBQ0812613.1 hypothetical protein [Marinobacter sp.]|tara:strand:- start:13160 stop:14566 length:1407 start_codon:yes stop_codon:yes gene_type:complete